LSKTLEWVLAEYRKNSATNPETIKQITAFRFYLRDLLYQSAVEVRERDDGINNYSRLVHKCVQWSHHEKKIVCFVSFNFDPLLEWACQEKFHFNPAVLSDYFNGERIFVLKPHGSVLWAWESSSVPADNVWNPYQLVIESGELATSNELRLVASNEPEDTVFRQGSGLRYGALPVLALPIAGSKEFVWPEEQDHLFNERIQIGAFGKVLTIGWRANEEHFLKILESRVANNALVYTVTGNSPKGVTEVMRNLSPIIRPMTGQANFTDGFSNFVNGDIIDNLLST
jgi:hypothetical protein